MADRVIRIFLSAPSDIVEERGALESLIAEINDVVLFLAPEREVKLELVHYSTHVYPSVTGAAQKTIDQQLPKCDIYLGAMWKRCGTPTSGAQSGTIYEFEQALKHREEHKTPTIMFFFCTQDIQIPNSQDEIEQLSRVLAFRQRIDAIGYTVTYPTKDSFRERVRVTLLRALADILRDQLPVSATVVSKTRQSTVPEGLLELCQQYDDIRRDMKAGAARTQRMTGIVDAMKAQAPQARDVYPLLKVGESAGPRLAAVSMLQVFPSPDELSWLADRLEPSVESPFIGFHAAIALLQAVRSLPASDYSVLRAELRRALALASKNPNDPPRIRMIELALSELGKKSSAANPSVPASKTLALGSG